VEVKLSDFSFLQKGTGKDLLFLHGYLSSKEAFARQIAYFSKFYRVTALDFVGFGNSAALQTAYSVGDYAKWLHAAMFLLRIKRPHVVAHSFGCRVAVKLASEHRSAFDKIVLTGPAGIILKRGFSYRVKVKTYRLVRRFAPKFAEKRFGSAEYRTLSPVMKESYKKIVNEDLRDCARKVENPVLILEGERDSVTTRKEAEIYAAAFPNACLRLVPGGHFAFVDDPFTFNLLAEEFLYG
jgi:pimeloyl-ACP methyl ester carboxylesterase